jgi:hypothetical protein
MDWRFTLTSPLCAPHCLAINGDHFVCKNSCELFSPNGKARTKLFRTDSGSDQSTDSHGDTIDQFVKLCSINARILNVFKAFDERKASSIHGNTSPKLIFGDISPEITIRNHYVLNAVARAPRKAAH